MTANLKETYINTRKKIEAIFESLREIEQIAGCKLEIMNQFIFSTDAIVNEIKETSFGLIPLSGKIHHKYRKQRKSKMPTTITIDELIQVANKINQKWLTEHEKKHTKLDPQKVNTKNIEEVKLIKLINQKDEMIKFVNTLSESLNDLSISEREIIYYCCILNYGDVKTADCINVSTRTVQRIKKDSFMKLEQNIAIASLRNCVFMEARKCLIQEK